MLPDELPWRLDLGATVLDSSKVCFKVWAPAATELSVALQSRGYDRAIPMNKDERGYFSATASDVRAGEDYFYAVDGQSRYPDPASRFQPQGVHGPSRIVDPDTFQWEDDAWEGISLRNYIIYELHVGTFTHEGDFASVTRNLDYLADLGITALELMPVAQFPGSRNWGYDGTFPFAPQNTYGGPEGLKALINSAHKRGIAVVLDVVYNHFGPEGNWLHRFGPYFTDRYKTPWGDAVNFDGPFSDEVKRFFIINALYWIMEYHVDALRLDAVHGILDSGAHHFLQELSDAVHALSDRSGRQVFLIAESDLNDVKIINPAEKGGYALDAQWNDDFHHALHAVLTGEKQGHYEDFGSLSDFATALREGFVYSGRYSYYRKRRHGNSSLERPAEQFVVFAQSHDQVGNRAKGDRLSGVLSLEKLKLAAASFLLSPYIPLLFMGEEYGEPAPFLYFVSHADAALLEAVREGRRSWFSDFRIDEPLPDPADKETFEASALTLSLHDKEWHNALFMFYKELIRLRKTIPALVHLSKEHLEIDCKSREGTLVMRRWFDTDEVFCVMNFNARVVSIELSPPMGRWRRVLDSSTKEWFGAGSLSPEFVVSYPSRISLSLNAYSLSLYRRLTKEP